VPCAAIRVVIAAGRALKDTPIRSTVLLYRVMQIYGDSASDHYALV
jgi:hypothetical protein